MSPLTLSSSAREPSELPDVAHANLLQNLRVERALLDALDALSPYPVVSFKGTLMTRLVWGDLACRASTDNDLLVRVADWDAALSQLLSRGYRFCSPAMSRARARTLLEVELYPPPHEQQVVLDLHRVLFAKVPVASQEAHVWEHLVSVPLHGREVSTLSPELLLVHAVEHAVSHILSQRTLNDLHQSWLSLKERIDLERLERLARATVGDRIFAAVLALACEEDMPLAPQGALRARAARSLLHGPARSPARALLALLLVSPSRAADALRNGLFPGVDELRDRYGAGAPLELHRRHWAALWSRLQNEA